MSIVRNYDALADDLARSAAIRKDDTSQKLTQARPSREPITLVRRPDAGRIGDLAAALTGRGSRNKGQLPKEITLPLDNRPARRRLRIPLVGIAFAAVVALVLTLI